MELLDIVNEYGIPTGKTVEREIAHRYGVRHRTAHVWIFRISNKTPQVLLQKRSLNKDSYPGCYDISSAGHILAGEGYQESALRELKEELGVNATADELIYCGERRFEFREIFHKHEFWDNQVSNIYLLYRDMDVVDFTIQKSEIDAILWTDLEACINMVKQAKAPNCIHTGELKMISSVIMDR